MRQTLDASFYDCSQKPYKETITGKPHFIMLHRYCAFLQIEGLWEFVLSKLTGTIFLTSFLISCLRAVFWQFLPYFELFLYNYYIFMVIYDK